MGCQLCEKRRRRRHYSDEERALALAALAANRGNLRRTARQFGIPRSSLQAWQNGDRHPEAAESAALKKRELGEALEETVRKLLDGISPEMIGRASLLDIVKAAGIAVDKMLALQETCGKRPPLRG